MVNTLARLLGITGGGVALQSVAYRCGSGDPTKPGLISGRGPENFGLAQRKIFADVTNYRKTVASYTPAAGAGRRHSGAGSRVTLSTELLSRQQQQQKGGTLPSVLCP